MACRRTWVEHCAVHSDGAAGRAPCARRRQLHTFLAAFLAFLPAFLPFLATLAMRRPSECGMPCFSSFLLPMDASTCTVAR